MSKPDWLTTKKYWDELSKHFVWPDDRKKVDFINQIIFESSGQNELSNTGTITTTETEIPSINTMNEIMKEIDNEVAITTTTTTAQTKEESKSATIDEEMKKFIVEPVE